MADQGAPTDVSADAPALTGPSLPVGTHVETMSGFDASWQTGFVVEEVTAIGYRLRRESDGALLPEIPHEQVRRRRKRSTWWV